MATLSRLALVACIVGLTACGPGASPTPPPTATPTVAPASGTPGPSAACVPTDQDAFVYNPARLKVLAPCVYATGTVAAVRTEADGDYHVLVALDPPYASLVNAANSGIELGDLVVEPVCEHAVTQTDAIATCAGDHDPIAIAGLATGIHVWLQGRYVTDSDHGGWAEFHPLYAWGIAPGTGVALPSTTPGPIIDNEAP